MKTGIRVMPIGKYKGQPTSNVPASWFHWFWHNANGGQTHINIIAHIRANMHALQSADATLVWDEKPRMEGYVIHTSPPWCVIERPVTANPL